jgi:hypothetical protein
LVREKQSPRKVFGLEKAETTEEDSDREVRELAKFRRAIASPRDSLLSYATSAFEIATEKDLSSAPASDPK